MIAELKRQTKKKNYVIHPIMFSIYYGLNSFIGMQFTQEKWRLLVVLSGIILMASLIWYISFLLTKKLFKSAIITSLVIIFSFSLETIYRAIVKIPWMPRSISTFITTITGQFTLYFGLILVVILLSFIKTKKDFQLGSYFFDIVSIVFITFIVIAIWPSARVQQNARSLYSNWKKNSDNFLSTLHPTKDFSSDVFYLVFDAFGSQVTFDNMYGYDGIDLVGELTKKGFRVINDGQPNYNQTVFSVPSALNMNTIQNLISDLQLPNEYQFSTTYLSNHNILFDFFESKGYDTVTFSTGNRFSEITTSNFYLSPSNLPDPYYEKIIDSSFLSLFYWKDQYKWHIEKVSFTLQKIKEIDSIKEPVFVYAHVMIPHPPFVFDKDGSVQIPEKKFIQFDNSDFIKTDDRANYLTGYRAQVEFAATQILEIVDSIRNKNPNAVIIIQGDHGPGAYFDQLNLDNSNLDERGHILNAYYFPDGDYSLINDDITPINSFRVVLNKYFGTDLPFLENRTFFSTYDNPYLFVDVTDRLR